MMTNDSNSCPATDTNAVRNDRCRMARPAAVIMAVLLLLSTSCGRSVANADTEDPLADFWQALQANNQHFPAPLHAVMQEAWDARHLAERRTLRPVEPMQGVTMRIYSDAWHTVAGNQTLKCDYSLFVVEARRQDAGATQKSMNFSVFDQDGKLYFSLRGLAIDDGRSVQRRAKIIWRSGAQLMVSAILPEFIPNLVPPISVNEYVHHSKTLVKMLDNDGQTYLDYDLESQRFVPVHIICKDTPTGHLLTLRLTQSNYEASMELDRSIRIVEFTAGGIRYVLADETEFERDFVSPEGMMSVDAPLDCWLPAGTEAEAIDLRLHFRRDARLPNTARQSVFPDDEAKSLLVHVKPEMPAEGGTEILVSDETIMYLEPDRMHQSDHPDIVMMANTIVEGITDPVDRCKALADWIRANIAYTQEVAMGDALQTLHIRRGDCTEYAALFIAFARALGIPAREAGGWIIGEASVTGHAWCEVYLGDRWYEIDPGTERLWIGANYISQHRTHFYILESANLVSWTAHGKQIVPDKTRPLWTFRNGVYHNRIYGISVSMPRNTRFLGLSDGNLLPEMREGRAVPSDVNAILFVVQELDRSNRITGILTLSLLAPESTVEDHVAEFQSLSGSIYGSTFTETEQFDSEIGRIVTSRIEEGVIGYRLPPRDNGSFPVLISHSIVGSDGRIEADRPMRTLPEVVLDLWRRIEVGKQDIE